ncbi:MAG: M48 family metallopeptidase [Abditibacteriaceae bacterium]
MYQKLLRHRVFSLFLCGLLITAPTRVLLAAPYPPASADETADNPQIQAQRDKEALDALATFEKDDLVKRVKEAPAAATPKEIDLGEKASKQMDKDTTIKILDPKKDEASKALYDKLTAMAVKLGKASGRPDIKYTVKVIDSKELNAFTLPNGNIYFYTGLLDTLYSDDEIAAVMAHEIGHNVCMHAVRGESKSKKFSLLNLAVLLAALGSGGNNAGAAVMFSQYLSVGLMNQYSEEFESEADIVGVSELIRAGYNPSAMVTVMKRFAVDEQRHPAVNAGIFQDHPEPVDRINAILVAMKAAKLEYTPREVNGVAGAEVVIGKENTTIQFRQKTLMEFPGKDDLTKERAKDTVDTLNRLLRNDLQLYNIQIAPDGVNSIISAWGTTIVTVTPADAALQKTTVEKCAAQWKQNFSQLFWRENLDGGL